MRKISFLGILYLSGLALLVSWQGVAHEAWPSYRFFQYLEILLGAGLGFFFWKWRYFLFLFLGMGFPRLYSIASGHPSHSSVFPLLLGLSIGGFLVHLFWRMPSVSLSAFSIASLLSSKNSSSFVATPSSASSATEIPPPESRGARCLYQEPVLWLLALLAFETLRAFWNSYGTPLLEGEGLKDHALYANVSANYAWFLASGLSLQLFGPLLFAATDRLLPWQKSNRDWQFLSALAWIGLLNLAALVLQSLGNMRLTVGAGDAWQATGRLPALMTDSGASSLFLPILLFCLYFWIVLAIEKKQPFRKGLWRIVSLGLMAGLWFFCARFSGRQFFLVSLSLFLIWLLSRLLGVLAVLGDGEKESPFFLAKKWNFSRNFGKERFLLFIGLGLGLLLLFLLVFFLSEPLASVPALQRLLKELHLFGRDLLQGNWQKALLTLLPHRYYQYEAGWQLFVSHPWLGTGLGSFMVYSVPLIPKGIPIDNPGGLWIGFLSDMGILGFLVLSWAAFLAFGEIIRFCKKNRSSVSGDAHRRAFACLLFCLLSLLPSSFFGYHILYPEYSVFISILLLRN